MKKYISIFAIAIALIMSACSDNWLNKEPGGSTITENQYQNMEDALRGTLLGIYSSMHQYGGDHDVFGVRAIDMYGDFTCGDMAMSTFSYGWFQTDELLQSYTRRAYLWSFYYNIIRSCNKAINAVDAQLAAKYPNADDIDKNDPAFIKDNAEIFFYYGEILAMRGWCYSNLQKWFCMTPAQIEQNGSTLEEFVSLPIYTEEVTLKDSIIGAPMASAADVYLRAEEDLIQAIDYLDLLEGEGMVRSLKREVNADAARLILAYSYLNKGDYTKAAKYAEEFINTTSCTLLPLSDVLTTGFADANSTNWVWGEDMTVESTTSLASFFGQVDIFSYSYAWAGDVKGIDKNLYEDITGNATGKTGHPWDIRAKWFNNIYNAKKQYQFAPDGKFYSPAVKQANGYKSVPKATEIDRDWLSDDVYMRTELGYLIAAEANCRLGDNAKGAYYLTQITDNRIFVDKDSEYNTWKATLSDNETLLEEIRYNWRVELWGEGFGLQTLRRFGKAVALGDNHKRTDKNMDPNSAANQRKVTFEVPSGEQHYNPYIRNAQTEELVAQR